MHVPVYDGSTESIGWSCVLTHNIVFYTRAQLINRENVGNTRLTFDPVFLQFRRHSMHKKKKKKKSTSHGRITN